MDPRVSRVPKLRSMDTGHLVELARDYVLHRATPFYMELANKMMMEAASRGNEEGRWVLERDDDSSAIAKYYSYMEIEDADDDYVGIDLLRESAERGFPPAMSCLGTVLLQQDDDEESIMWLQRAASLNDPLGMYRLAKHTTAEDERYALILRSAELGCCDSMEELLERYGKRLGLISRVFFNAKSCLYDDYAYSSTDIDAIFDRRKDGHDFDELDVQALYVAGKEMEGYECLWPPDQRANLEHQLVIDFYLDLSHRARRAALQTVVALRPLLGHDVARMIARHVYATRELDTAAWWHHEEDATASKKIRS